MRIAKVKIISIINVVAIFNLVYIKDSNKEKIAFLTYYRLYKYLIILFSLYNALRTF